MSQLRRSTQTHQNETGLAKENWAYLRFCILSFLNLRPSHLFLIISTPTFGTTKLQNKKIKCWSHVPLLDRLRLLDKEEEEVKLKVSKVKYSKCFQDLLFAAQVNHSSQIN